MMETLREECSDFGVARSHPRAFYSSMSFSLFAALDLCEWSRTDVPNQPGKRAVYTLACGNQSMPLVADCSLNAPCRSNLILSLLPTRAAFNASSRCNLILPIVHRW